MFRPKGRRMPPVEVPNMKIGEGDWVVVCDGAKALILQNAGDGMYPNLKTREVHQQAIPKTEELGTDEPGRSFSSSGTAAALTSRPTGMSRKNSAFSLIWQSALMPP